MSLTEQFLKTYPFGTKIDYDGSYGCQCFDVINAYIQLITGKNPNMHLLKASDIYKRPEGIIPAGVNYQKLANTKEFIPQNGDIIVWENASWNMNYGHTAICVNSDLNSGTVIQQNGLNVNEGTTYTTWNWHKYNFLGVIRLVIDKPEPSQNFKKDYLKSGETLSHIGARYNIHFTKLINPKTMKPFDPNSYSQLPIGQEILIPIN